MNQDESSYSIIKFKASELPERYHPVIFSNFLRTLRRGNKYFQLIEPDAYFKAYHSYIETILLRSSAIVKLAVLSDNHDVVLGWSLAETKKLHYVYVGGPLRRLGIASSLLNEPFSEFTHITNVALIIWPKKYPTATFNPF